MTEPATLDSKDAPTIRLAGKDWPVPKLAVRQWRQISGPLKELNKKIRELPEGHGGEALLSLSQEEFDRLITQPVYVALTRAHPEMKIEEFLDMTVSEDELMTAWFIVRRQSGLFIEGGAAKPSGETEAAAR